MSDEYGEFPVIDQWIDIGTDSVLERANEVMSRSPFEYTPLREEYRRPSESLIVASCEVRMCWLDSP